MIYRIVTYDKTTERMKGDLPIPRSAVDQIKQIAGFGPQDDGLGEYPLDEEQTRQIAGILDFKADPEHFYIMSSHMSHQKTMAYSRRRMRPVNRPNKPSSAILSQSCGRGERCAVAGSTLIPPSPL
jgi:hypothetical protein